MDRTEKRVWGYCRCGGIDQAKMEKQAEQLKQYAESCGYTFLGYTKGRGSSLEPNSSEMIEIERAVKTWEADTLIISDVSRLSRKVDQLIGSLKYLAQIHVKVECTNGVDLSLDGSFKDIVVALTGYISSSEPEYKTEYEEEHEFELNDDSEELER